jgi:hypothetical protein
VILELAFSSFICIIICKVGFHGSVTVSQSVFSAVKTFTKRQCCNNKDGDDATGSRDGGDAMNAGGWLFIVSLLMR